MLAAMNSEKKEYQNFHFFSFLICRTYDFKSTELENTWISLDIDIIFRGEFNQKANAQE